MNHYFLLVNRKEAIETFLNANAIKNFVDDLIYFI